MALPWSRCSCSATRDRVLDDDWTVVTEDGSLAAHFEHTVRLTDRGPWVLTAADGGRERLAALGVSYGGPDSARPGRGLAPSGRRHVHWTVGSVRAALGSCPEPAAHAR